MIRHAISAGDRQRGFSLVGAIFVLVVLGALGAFIVTIGMQQRTTVSYAVQGSRAYYAASTGIEWGVHEAISDGACPASATFAPGGAGLDGFAVTVTCTSTAHHERGTTYNVYVLTARSAFGTYGDPYYFTRHVRVSVTDAPPP